MTSIFQKKRSFPPALRQQRIMPSWNTIPTNSLKKEPGLLPQKDLILVDTKYEFGKKDGKIYLIDEINTPDSSRYFYADGYEDRIKKGEQQKQLSKEFVRQWLIENNFQGKEGQPVPEMTDEFVNQISERYIELYENIIGEKFERADLSDVQGRIEKNINIALKELVK